MNIVLTPKTIIIAVLIILIGGGIWYLFFTPSGIEKQIRKRLDVISEAMKKDSPEKSLAAQSRVGKIRLAILADFEADGFGWNGHVSLNEAIPQILLWRREYAEIGLSFSDLTFE